MKIIDGENKVLGRLASYTAKEALKGEEIIIVNCDKVVVVGNRKNIKSEFLKKTQRKGGSLKGPKYIKKSEMIVKRAIKGMLPDFRKGRGKEAYKKIKCYIGVPKEFENMKKTPEEKIIKKNKFIGVKEIFNE